MEYEVVLDTYSGPLDLLMHLIRKQEIDIHDIPIALLTEQFIGYLRAMEELSLEVASEFLVMAATLLAIKSRMLLPRRVLTEEGIQEPIDPREELVRQLVEYQRCKWAADELKSRVQLQSLVYTRAPADLDRFRPAGPAPLEGISLWAVVDAFRKLLLRVPAEKQIAQIKGQVVSVADRMKEVLQHLKRWQTTTFYTLMLGHTTRADIVSTFLAVLELVKLGSIYCTQSESFADIDIHLQGESA